MDPRLQRRVQRYGWDKAAALYEAYWQAQLKPAQDRLLALATLRPGEHVLEVASGTGLVTFMAAAAVGPSGSVLATDISEAMVERVRQGARARGFTNIPARRMDAETLDVPAASFDVVLCALGLMYVPDPAAAVASMIHALKPGGRLIAAVWGARSQCGWADIFPIVDARVRSEVCPMFFALGTGEALANLMRASGLKDVRSERLPTVLHYDSEEEACGAAFAGGPVALAYSRFDAPTRAAAHAEYLESIDRWRSGETFDVPGEFVVTCGVR